MLSEGCRWVLASVSDIDCNGTRFAGRELIQSHLPASLLDQIDHGADLVSIGAASLEGTVERETERAQERANNMATWVSQRVKMTGRIWIVNLGQFKRACRDCGVADSSAQRPVILATIVHQENADLASDLIKESMKANGAIPDPDNYTRFEVHELK